MDLRIDIFKIFWNSFSNDKDSHGLNLFHDEFMGKSNNHEIVGGINIDRVFTIGYETNGNRIVLTKDNYVYIYVYDLVIHHYEKVHGIPKNTFFHSSYGKNDEFYEELFCCCLGKCRM